MSHLTCVIMYLETNRKTGECATGFLRTSIPASGFPFFRFSLFPLPCNRYPLKIPVR